MFGGANAGGSSSMLAKPGDAESTTTATMQPQVAEGFQLLDNSATTQVGGENSTRGINRGSRKPREVADSPLMAEAGSHFREDPANLGHVIEDEQNRKPQQVAGLGGSVIDSGGGGGGMSSAEAASLGGFSDASGFGGDAATGSDTGGDNSPGDNGGSDGSTSGGSSDSSPGDSGE